MARPFQQYINFYSLCKIFSITSKTTPIFNLLFVQFLGNFLIRIINAIASNTLPNMCAKFWTSTCVCKKVMNFPPTIKVETTRSGAKWSRQRGRICSDAKVTCNRK